MLLTNVQVKSFKADLAKGDVTLTFALDLGRDTLDARFQLGEWLDEEQRVDLTIEPHGGYQLPLFNGTKAAEPAADGEGALAETDYAPAVVHDADAPVVAVEDGQIVAPDDAPAPADQGETLDEFIDGLDIDGDEDSPTGMQEG